MGSELKVKTLGEIAENVSRPFDFSSFEEVAFINTGDVLEGRFLHNTFKSKSGLPGQAKKRIEKGDILFSEIRPGNKRYAIVDFDPEGYVVSTKFMVIRLKDFEVDPQYFYTVLTSQATLEEFQRIAESRSGTFPQITFDAVSYYPINIPPLSEQKAIAHILNVLDEKIELNRRMNVTLEAMTQALFKSWFVDFDPVIDNALAAGNSIPEGLQARAESRKSFGYQSKSLPDDLQQKFPNHFIHTDELGWLPAGWKIVKFEDIANIIMGQSPKGETYNELGEGMPLINGPVEFGYYFAQKSKWTTSPTKIAKRGDLIVCVRGSTTGRFVKSNDIYCLGRGVCAIRANQSQVFTDCIFMDRIKDLLKLTTGSTFPNWSGPTLKSFLVSQPNNNLITIFDYYTKDWHLQLEANVTNSNVLTDIRNLLLPKLVSGQLCVQQAEMIIDNNLAEHN